MTLPNTFANETSPGMQELDQNFAAVADMGIWNCTATGTNTVALTTSANQPAVSAYTDRQRFQFIWPNNTTNSVQASVNSLATLPVYLITGVQAGNGDGTAGTPVEVIYLAALNTGSGGFQVWSGTPSSVAAAATNGSLRGLRISNNSSTPSTKIDITAGTSVLVTTAGLPKFLTSVSVTIDLTTTGANGMDVGSRPTSGWVYCYVISNGTLTAGLSTATSPTAGGPTLPGGYIYYAYVGAMYCDGSQNLLRSTQSGRDGEYNVVASTNTAVIPNIDNGIKGTYSTTSPVLTAVTVTGNTGTVPLTAGSITVVGGPSYDGNITSASLVAATTAWGGTNNGPSGSNKNAFPIAIGTTVSSVSQQAKILLVGSTIAWCGSNIGAAIWCQGWTDYWSCG